MECKLIIRRRSVKIGVDWQIFCTLHELSVKDHNELFFEVEIEKPNIHIKVHYPLI